jgi:hypothetical protein
MPTLPTILFSAFQSGADPQRQSWARFREQVNTRSHAASTATSSSVVNRARAQAAPVASTGQDESGIWRLLAPNNRELGRSSFLYGTFAAAHGHVLQLREAEGLVAATVSGPLAQSFGWFITLKSMPIMTCTRWYPNAAASTDAARAALAAFSVAVVGDAPLRATSSGRRTTRAPRPGARAAW